MAASRAYEINPVSGNKLGFIQEPSSASRGKAFEDRLERNFAPVIVIARDAEHRRFDARKNFQSLGEILFLLDDVAGETDELRRERVDAFDNRLKISAVTLVMDIGEMNEPARRFAGC